MKYLKKILMILTIAIAFISCNNDDGNDSITPLSIVGNWNLTATLADPGDGSGTFQPASGKSLNFTDQGVVNCNVSFCFGSLTQATSTGTYDVMTTTIDVENCIGTYIFIDADTIEISHLCIEPCGERYVRVN